MTDIIELSPAAPVDMADEWFNIASLEHFWMEWRFGVIRQNAHLFLQENSQVLEIGCGNGIVLRQFEKYLGRTIDGCDLNTVALEAVEEFSGKKFIYNIYDRNPEMMGQYDTVILLDVVEHIDDDVDFLKTSCEHIREGGFVLINVPALNSLFSPYDTRAGHKRRYTKKMMRKLLKDAGIELVRMQYWGFSLLPLAFVRKYMLKMVAEENIIKTGFKPPRPWLNTALKGMMRAELSLMKSPPLGTSLLAIGQKWT